MRINNTDVTVTSWYDAFQRAEVPFSMTFRHPEATDRIVAVEYNGGPVRFSQVVRTYDSRMMHSDPSKVVHDDPWRNITKTELVPERRLGYPASPVIVSELGEKHAVVAATPHILALPYIGRSPIKILKLYNGKFNDFTQVAASDDGDFMVLLDSEKRMMVVRRRLVKPAKPTRHKWAERKWRVYHEGSLPLSKTLSPLNVVVVDAEPYIPLIPRKEESTETDPYDDLLKDEQKMSPENFKFVIVQFTKGVVISFLLPTDGMKSGGGSSKVDRSQWLKLLLEYWEGLSALAIIIVYAVYMLLWCLRTIINYIPFTNVPVNGANGFQDANILNMPAENPPPPQAQAPIARPTQDQPSQSSSSTDNTQPQNIQPEPPSTTKAVAMDEKTDELSNSSDELSHMNSHRGVIFVGARVIAKHPDLKTPTSRRATVEKEIMPGRWGILTDMGNRYCVRERHLRLIAKDGVELEQDSQHLTHSHVPTTAGDPTPHCSMVPKPPLDLDQLLDSLTRDSATRALSQLHGNPPQDPEVPPSPRHAPLPDDSPSPSPEPSPQMLFDVDPHTHPPD